MTRSLILSLAAVIAISSSLQAQTREQKVRADRKKVESEGFWIYNDLAKGFAQAKKTGKPLLVAFRCIPCEECVKLDDELVDRDPRVRPLLEKFVCVRVVSTNGLDLSLFQYDYDQSFAVFMLNADQTIYGRFGTRSHRTEWSDDVSVEGLSQALQGAMALHGDYPRNKADLAAKRGPKPAFASPEQYPLLRGKYGTKLDYKGNVVRGCIHCHQIGDAQRAVFRKKRMPMPDEVLFQYPHPKAIGLILDPKKRASVVRVEEGTPAQKAGFQKGDEILTLSNQPLLSIADVQWVLHHTVDAASIPAKVKRNGTITVLTLKLPKGWRRRDDIAWRVSSWPLRRMAAGGLVLEELPAAERRSKEIAAGRMALRVKYVGQYGPHAAGKRAGFRKGDIITSFDGQTNLMRESDLLAYAVNARRPGQRVPVMVLRGAKSMKLMLPMQE